VTVVGEPIARLEAAEKVTGAARYAVDHPVDDVAYVWPVQATIAKGRVTAVDATAARALPGVLAVLSPENLPTVHEVDDGELLLFQRGEVHYRGQFVAAVVAETLEQAREASTLVRVSYAEEPHDVVLRPDHPGLYAPETVNAGFPTDTEQGDVEGALAAAAATVDATYRTPGQHNNPMEPHATTAWWEGDTLHLIDATQGTTGVRQAVAQVLGIDPEQVRVRAPHVGGGFGSKGSARPNAPLAAIAARLVGRPVRLAVTRQMMFSVVGYRTPTIQRVRLGADGDGRLTAISHDVVEQTSTVFEFAEQTATYTRHAYAAPHRRTSHRLARLDVPTPRWMRAPGECPGSFALESAMDELAVALALDPVEFRIRNEPALDPESGGPYSSRNLVACLREGAARFGWSGRDPRPALRREGRWLVGTGVASAAYPAMARPSHAAVGVQGGRYAVRVNATDIGTGARTVLWQIAVDALGVPAEQVTIDIGDSTLGDAPVAGGSAGSASWGWAVHKACTRLREQLSRTEGAVPPGGLEVTVDTTDELAARKPFERLAFGAHFVEVRVDAVTGEVRVPRMLGVFAVGRVLNARTARSQLIGGMTMGLSMALHEEGRVDPRFGDFANADLASYHVSACADVQDIEAVWLDEPDPYLNPMGSKGVGEIGIVGSAAAVVNAVHHATGVRVRELPVHVEDLLPSLP
jgi:xanthine dehydrogenase YagR molybdenum-binding subunit